MSVALSTALSARLFKDKVSLKLNKVSSCSDTQSYKGFYMQTPAGYRTEETGAGVRALGLYDFRSHSVPLVSGRSTPSAHPLSRWPYVP